MVLNQHFNTCWTLFFCLLLGKNVTIINYQMLCFYHKFVYVGQGIDGQQSTSSTPLVYVYTRGFTQIWRDTGSNAASDVSIWKPTSDQGINNNIQNLLLFLIFKIDCRLGFFALGDYIQSDYKYPSKNVLMVMDKNDGLVVPPDSFT
jgi:hypothetical protein